MMTKEVFHKMRYETNPNKINVKLKEMNEI